MDKLEHKRGKRGEEDRSAMKRKEYGGKDGGWEESGQLMRRR